MLEVKNWKVYDLRESIISCRNAMRTDMPEYTDDEFEKGLERAKKLVKANKNKDGITCHANFRTGIRVSFDLKYTQYITKQFQRYHWFDYVSSSSMMHKITKMDFGKCCNKYVEQSSIDLMNELIAGYNEISENMPAKSLFCKMDTADVAEKLYAENMQAKSLICEMAAADIAEILYAEAIAKYKQDVYEAFMRVISNCPMGCELFVRVSTNYEQLATIYRQRKNHKLKEDWGAFIDFIKQLPYADELIIGNF